jgi:large subunit ribosomal protein L3
MSEYNAPRRGSLSYYPRVRAAKETPTLKGYDFEKLAEAKPLNFICYKVGMLQIVGKNVHKQSPTFGMDVVVPATVLECPDVKVFAVRAYRKKEIGVEPMGEVNAENIEKELLRKIQNFFEKGTDDETTDGKAVAKKETKEKIEVTEKKLTIADFEKQINNLEYFTLLVHTRAAKIGFKKRPDVTEIFLSGSKEKQLAYAKEKLGKDVSFEECFNPNDFLDVRAVTKGHGFQGVIKRFNVTIQRAKSKKNRVVGSIGPWHPATVMYTVARAGQMGYQNRVEANKKFLRMAKPEEVNPKAGFANYGFVKDKCAIMFGSLPGPAKRCLALRKCMRPKQQKGIQLESISRILN